MKKGKQFCLSCNLSAFVSRFQQSRIRELCKFFGQESHRPPKSKSARTLMAMMWHRPVQNIHVVKCNTASSRENVHNSHTCMN